jgi:hypothetical protein
MATRPAAAAVPQSTPLITSNFKSLADVRAAMESKLRDSALTAEDARALHLCPYTAQQVASDLELTFNRAGFHIPYFTLTGERTKFFRFRYLEYDNARGFGALVHANGNGAALKGDLRYTQPAAVPPALYLPPTVDWKAIAADPAVSLVITEGELKAACLCKHNIPTVGLGGVWSFRSARLGQALLPAFKDIRWEKRTVYVCYDSDARTNPNVVMAENALCDQLTDAGALLLVCRMPALKEDGKTGVDDYIAARGVDAFKATVLNAAEAYLPSAELRALNAEVVYVQNPGLILIPEPSMQRITPKAFVEHAYADRHFHVTVGDKLVEKQTAREWLKWPGRMVVRRTVYRPGQPRFIDGCLNTWTGWGCAPQKGNVSRWLRLLQHLFTGYPDSAERQQWFQQWLAYPLQHPGTKLFSAAVVWGIKQGTGKSLIGYTAREIYGPNFTEIGDKNLHGNFNEWAENKQLVMGDEIASSGERKRDVADRMKSMITQKELRLNPKFIPSYTVDDCINYYFTSNHPDAFFMEDDDRRFFVHEVEGAPLEAAFYRDYCAWALNGGVGAQNIFYHLLNLDLTGFDPQGHALQTSSKREMKYSGRGDVETFVYRLRDDPDAVLYMHGCAVTKKLWTVSELATLMETQGIAVKGLSWLARDLRKAGFRPVCGGNTVNYAKQILYPLRDCEALHKLAGIDSWYIADQYFKERKLVPRPGNMPAQPHVLLHKRGRVSR